jgi:hypothetical protein
MPAAVYALASDTLIGVVRAHAIARASHAGQALADDEPTPIAALGAVALWLVRLALAPASTITGFRRWAVEECPVAPGRTQARPQPALPTGQDSAATSSLPPAQDTTTSSSLPPALANGSSASTRPDQKPPGKQARMLALAAQRHDLTALPLKRVSPIANAIAAEISLSPGTARRVLLAHVRSLQNGTSQQESPCT